MIEVTDKTIEAWRLCIDAAKIKLGEFNWPWALGLALDEIERLRATVTPTVEIGGQTMTQAQFDAARYPLLATDQEEYSADEIAAMDRFANDQE